MSKDHLKQTIDILEDHLKSYGHELASDAFIFIQNNIYKFKIKMRNHRKSK